MTALGTAIERARQIDLLDLARQYTTLTKIAANEYAGPCPSCGGYDRFRLNSVKKAFLCRKCDGKGKGAIDFVILATGCDFRAALEKLDAPSFAAPIKPAKGERTSPDEEHARNLRSAACIIAGLQPIAGTLGEQYLRSVRKIDCNAIRDVLGEVDSIGWHPSLFFREPGHPLDGKRLGAIVTVLTDPLTAKPTGAISRTFLSQDGVKVCKARMLGGGGICRLSADEDVLSGLHVCEGVEGALTGMAHGFRPMWAAGSTAQLRTFPILAGVTRLTVLADHDGNRAGEAAAREVEKRWQTAGRRVRVLMRNTIGDLNDIELGRKS
jgi:hypothetical protein